MERRSSKLFALLAAVLCVSTARGDNAPAPPPARVLTLSLLRQMLAAPAAFMRFVDPARGVLSIEYYDNASGELVPHSNKDGDVMWAERLCGAQLSERLETIRRDLAETIKVDRSLPAARRIVSCSNEPTVECVRRGGHDITDYHLQFIVDEKHGLVLDTVLELQRGTMTTAWIQRGDAFVAQERKRLSATRCTR
jgi:hypothetical protein